DVVRLHVQPRRVVLFDSLRPDVDAHQLVTVVVANPDVRTRMIRAHAARSHELRYAGTVVRRILHAHLAVLLGEPWILRGSDFDFADLARLGVQISDGIDTELSPPHVVL